MKGLQPLSGQSAIRGDAQFENFVCFQYEVDHPLLKSDTIFHSPPPHFMLPCAKPAAWRSASLWEIAEG